MASFAGLTCSKTTELRFQLVEWLARRLYHCRTARENFLISHGGRPQGNSSHTTASILGCRHRFKSQSAISRSEFPSLGMGWGGSKGVSTSEL